MKKGLWISLLTVVFKMTHGQASALDSFFNDKINHSQLNGQLLLSANHRQLIRVSGGYAAFNLKTPNNESAKFNLASISKIFTAVAVLQLKEKGKLKLHDKVVKYLPQFPFADISIRHLLSHTSGLPDIEIYGYLFDIDHDTIVTNKDVLPALQKWDKGLLFKPGDNWRYSNPGYNVLALLVEKISKTSFTEYISKQIFLPAGMKNTHIAAPTKANPVIEQDVRLHVQPYWYDREYSAIDGLGQYRYFIYTCSGTIGEKNIISTIDDLGAFDEALFSGKLIKPATMQEAFIPVKLNNGSIWYANQMDTMLGEGKGSYGLGFEIFEIPGVGKGVGHGGFMGGLATFYYHNIESRQTIIAYQNTSSREFGNIVTASLYLMNNKKPFQVKLQESLARWYGNAMKEKGIDAATVLFNELRSDTVNYYLSEQEMNWLGYDLLYFAIFENHKLYGLEVHKVNSLLFPSSFNVYDSYAESLLQNGKEEEAIRMYKKSLQLNPDNEGGKEALKHLLEK